MQRIPYAIALVALCTLAAELLLTRVFDVILYPNLGYMIITGAMFAFGLAGIYTTLRPLPEDTDVEPHLARVTAWMALSLVLLRPALNAIPFRFENIAKEPVQQVLWFLLMYVVITLPFFLAGLVFARAFATWADEIQSLYFYDLCGAAIGCVIFIPFLPLLGPGGLLMLAAAALGAAAALFHGSRKAMQFAAVFALVAVLVPALAWPDYLSFTGHKGDRGIAMARREGRSEIVRWDPISKVEVIHIAGYVKNIVYDGGSQSSFLYRLEGGLERLRTQLDRFVRQNDEAGFLGNFWTRGVLIAHYFKRDQDQKVMVIGSAAGQEVKAALAYGAGHVDAVEMVGTVVDFGKNEYAEFNGGIFNDPRVNVQRGEGRGFLRSQGQQYDIIQIFSNHSSSSIAAGAGALDPTYLITADAFVDYFSHLTDNGVLQINHHTYPRIVSTAGLAWQRMGRDNLRDHVLVVSRNFREDDSLPSVLVKMQPWTVEEIRDIQRFLSMSGRYETLFQFDEDPRRPEQSLLTDEFYSGEISAETQARIPYRVVPTTDDRPYFKFLRRTWDPVEANDENFVPTNVAHYLNEQLRQGGGLPMDVIHLYVTGGVSFLFAVVFILGPLLLSRVGRRRWPGWISSLAYFGCLGAGFIIIELVFIHKLMHFVGFPLYTYSTVLFTVLIAAGCGSLTSKRLGIAPGSPRWWWPFVGVIVTGAVFLATHGFLIQFFLGAPTIVKVLVTAAYLFPVAFFMGMPFPLGILTIEQHSRSAVAWAWGMNGLFTVIGGLGSILISVFWGFRAGLLIGLGIYLLAGLLLARMRSALGHAA